MKVTLTEMHSIRDAIRTMYMSKRTWNEEIEQQLKEMVDHCTDRYGRPLDLPEDDELKIKFDKEVAKLLKWGQKHITMLRFEDISVVFHIDSSIYLQILYLAFFATTLCYLFQNVGQKFVNENIAALLLSLESVFGVFFSILFGQEIMTLQIGLGFMIIFISVLISETKLSFLHRGGKQ